MQKIWLLPLAITVIVFSTIGVAHAASADYFLKIDTIEGESEDSSHKGEIDVLSWSWGVSNSGSYGSGGGGGAGKVSMSDFQFTKKVDKATPKLFEKIANGEHIKEVKLVIRKAETREPTYLMITLQDVMVTSISMDGGTDGIPTETISLDAQAMDMEYVVESADGSRKKEFSGHVILMK